MTQSLDVQVMQVPALELSTPKERQAKLREINSRIQASFLELANVLRAAFENEDWTALNYISFASYAEDTLRVSKSEAYDLVKMSMIQALYPDLTPRMLDAGKANMRAVLPQLPDLTDYSKVEAWIDTAAVNSWRELQGAIRSEPMQYKERMVTCPNCGTGFSI